MIPVKKEHLSGATISIDFGFVGFRCVSNIDQWWAASQNARLENTQEGINSGGIEQSKNEERHVGMWQIEREETAHHATAKEEDFKKIALPWVRKHWKQERFSM